MIVYILITLLSLLANASIVKMLHTSIQIGQWLEIWQKYLAKWDSEGRVFLAKAGGLCELCFSYWITTILFIPYLVAMMLTFDVAWYVYIGWYLLYVPFGTMLSLYFIVKLFAKRDD